MHKTSECVNVIIYFPLTMNKTASTHPPVSKPFKPESLVASFVQWKL